MRHDHQLIFSLGSERLLLVWSEYYSKQENRDAKRGHAGIGDSAAYPSVTFVGDEALIAYYSRPTNESGIPKSS